MIRVKAVNDLALLARMRLTPKECISLQHELKKILEYVEILGTLDTKELSPMSHTTGLENVLRQDETRESSAPAQELIDAFSLKKERWAKVPKVINKEA